MANKPVTYNYSRLQQN